LRSLKNMAVSLQFPVPSYQQATCGFARLDAGNR